MKRSPIKGPRKPLRSPKPGQRSKFGNVSCVYNGRTFHSRKEADYAATLDCLLAAKDERKRVLAWLPQFNVQLYAYGEPICRMVVDFRVTFCDGRIEYHEVKGFATPEWNLKRKLLEAQLRQAARDGHKPIEYVVIK